MAAAVRQGRVLRPFAQASPYEARKYRQKCGGQPIPGKRIPKMIIAEAHPGLAGLGQAARRALSVSQVEEEAGHLTFQPGCFGNALGVPGDQVSRRPPQPFVSTMARQPAAAAVRTGWTTAATPLPS